MNKKKKRVAFIFGRPRLNEPKLQFMPFAQNFLRNLAEDGNNIIDVYITQSKTSHYTDNFPSNVNFIFLDIELQTFIL